jgi:AraC-like DNA-binding protein
MENTGASEKALKSIRDSIVRLTEQSDQIEDIVPGLTLYKRVEPSEPKSAMYEPTLCFVVRGSKRVMLGDSPLTYNARNYLITAVDVPTVVQVIEASREVPLLGIVLKLERQEISQLVMDSNLPAPPVQSTGPGMEIGKVTLPLISAFQRLIELHDTPEDIPILAPTIKREIYYRLLTGDQGIRLRQIALAGSQTHHVSKAIEWLKENFAQAFNVEDLARQFNMSKSTFHHHFRSLTAKSPLQYQKWLRLNEARRLMLIENQDAANASFEVGYESPSQFSREYSRLFGNSPARDISMLREAGDAN